MKTAIITSIDDNVTSNFENDFLDTLINDAKYNGQIFLIYYGESKKFANHISKKYNVKIFFAKKNFMVSNQRNINLPFFINKLPKNITNIMLIDSGDIWFQNPIDEVFELTKNSYGYVKQDTYSDKGFNLWCISQINNESIRKKVFQSTLNKKLINGGMIVGNRQKVLKIIKKVAKLIKKVNQDFFALDQALLNYVIRICKNGVSLPQKYNYALLEKNNKFEIKNNKFYDENNNLISIVHNLGNTERLFPNGRKNLLTIKKDLKTLPGTFWGIVTYFNPVGYTNKKPNYDIFAKSLKKQGLNLIAVELGFEGKKFELSNNDADILIQLKTDQQFWHKERLLNIGIDNLPKDCDKFVWLDCDVIFTNKNWVKESALLLEQYPAIQPFAEVIRLKKGQKIISDLTKIKKCENGCDVEGCRNYSMACRVSDLGLSVLRKTVNYHGYPGFAWAFRKEIFENKGLLDNSIFPGLDLIMAHLFYKNEFNDQCQNFLNENMEKSSKKWSKDIFPKIKGKVGYTNGTILHLWHGNTEDRNYGQIIEIIKNSNFNPEKDLEISKQGYYKLKGDLEKEFENYFVVRAEQGINFNKHVVSIINNKILQIKKNTPYEIDRMLGICGIFIKKISPKSYIALKFIEKKLRSLLY